MDHGRQAQSLRSGTVGLSGPHAVNVRDFGAVGDGAADDTFAFRAANASAKGRRLWVPEGRYRLVADVTLDTDVVFDGHLQMPIGAALILQKTMDFQSYLDAFPTSDEAFRRAVQALLRCDTLSTLNLNYNTITLASPVDFRRLAGPRTEISSPKTIINGTLIPKEKGWSNIETDSEATCVTSDPYSLTNIANMEDIKIGSRVRGPGVGREVYVRQVDYQNRHILLSNPVSRAAGTHRFYFTRHAYMLDFSKLEKVSNFALRSISLDMRRTCSGVILAPTGRAFQASECAFTNPKDKAMSSIGTGCQSISIENSSFQSGENDTPSTLRQSIGININGNDAKIRGCGATRFRHFAVISGRNSFVSGNHVAQGDGHIGATRTASFLYTASQISSTFLGNYLDNAPLEWTNEHDPSTHFMSGNSFHGLSMTGNLFLAGNVKKEFSFLKITPFGENHFLSGVIANGNMFRIAEGHIDRVDQVDCSFFEMNWSKFTQIHTQDSTFCGAISSHAMTIGEIAEQKTKPKNADPQRKNTKTRTKDQV